MTSLASIDGTKWKGDAELWLDPLGNQAAMSACTMSVEGNVVRYTWNYEGKDQAGSITLLDHGAEFVDTWHQPTPMRCRTVNDAAGLVQVQGTYGPAGDWGWRIGLSLRPSGELILQMTNLTPWGEEGRAVRMTGRKS